MDDDLKKICTLTFVRDGGEVSISDEAKMVCSWLYGRTLDGRPQMKADIAARYAFSPTQVNNVLNEISAAGVLICEQNILGKKVYSIRTNKVRL